MPASLPRRGLALPFRCFYDAMTDCFLFHQKKVKEYYMGKTCPNGRHGVITAWWLAKSVDA